MFEHLHVVFYNHKIQWNTYVCWISNREKTGGSTKCNFICFLLLNCRSKLRFSVLYYWTIELLSMYCLYFSYLAETMLGGHRRFGVFMSEFVELHHLQKNNSFWPIDAKTLEKFVITPSPLFAYLLRSYLDSRNINKSLNLVTFHFKSCDFLY